MKIFSVEDMFTRLATEQTKSRVGRTARFENEPMALECIYCIEFDDTSLDLNIERSSRIQVEL